MVDTSSFPRRTVLRALTVGAGLGVLPAVGHAAAGPRELGAGMAGADVRELQIRVAGWASTAAAPTFLPVNGVFDAATEAAVRRFQRAHGLTADGVAGSAVRTRLAAMEARDGSTVHFGWESFFSPDGKGFAGGAVDAETAREHARRLMYKLEALRHKVGEREVTVTGGFHSTAHRASGTHPYGVAADITVAGMSTYAVYQVAQTCGFSGLGPYTQSWLHCDSRAEALERDVTFLP